MLTIRTDTDEPSFFCYTPEHMEDYWEDLCAAINTPPDSQRNIPEQKYFSGAHCPTAQHEDGKCCPACDHMKGKCYHGYYAGDAS
jgi:hypothetical protein